MDATYEPREPHDDRCSRAGCRADWEVRYLAGSCELAQEHHVQLCDAHHSEFASELAVLRREPETPAQAILRSLEALPAGYPPVGA